MAIKSVKMKISKNKKISFTYPAHGLFNPKIRFLDQKGRPVARSHTPTHRQSEY